MTFICIIVYVVIGFFVMRRTNGGVPAMIASDGFPKHAIGLIIAMILLWPLIGLLKLILWIKQ